MSTPQIYFDHEKLVAYQRSIQFVVWANQILEQVRDGKVVLHETVSLLVGLIRSIFPERLGEELLPYRTSGEM